ncbi:MAG: hypothetical protein CAF44_001695 [Nitrospira sp. CG24D]|nr:MAG: hypothetical protein CAF44_001695 [Nitrospira sp. CG24D]
MPNNYAVLNSGSVVVEFWTGPVTHEELLAHERRHLSDPSVKPGAAVLVDAERAHFGTTIDEVKELADLYGQVIGRLKVGRIALLVNRETYERALVFLKEVEGYGVKVIVFNSLDIACTWLGLDVNVARTQLQTLQAQSVQVDSSPARS